MREFQIGDLDGCISDDRWRRVLIGTEPERGRSDPTWPDRFHRYHLHASQDAAANLHEFIPGVPIIFLTARPVRYADLTREWLWSKQVNPMHIIHRPNDDHRPSVEIKAMQLGWLTNPNNDYDVSLSEIISAIDDREPIIQMYRSLGIVNARIVRIGSEEHAEG